MKRKQEETVIKNGCGDPIPVSNLGNHIYFYCSVTKNSCLDLNKLIKKISDEMLKSVDIMESEDKYIYIHINSPGGLLYAVLSTIDTIKTCPIPIVSIIEGGTASAGTLMSVVCDYRIIHKNSYMLIHQMSAGTIGQYDEMKDDMQNFDQLMDKIKEIYIKHTKLTGSQLDEILKHDLWWSPRQCLDTGLVDEIVEPNEKKYGVDRKKLKL
jgi:ATP-dependent protease ClpP protease subunit